ncbi:MAG: GNAT family N-acetyltransferase [Gemmatimonadaceae bacterium]
MRNRAQCEIREAQLDDAPAVAELITQLGYATAAPDMAVRLRDITSAKAYLTLVAIKESRVVGMVGVGLAHFYERNGRYARILVLSVAEGERRAGVGPRCSPQRKCGRRQPGPAM